MSAEASRMLWILWSSGGLAARALRRSRVARIKSADAEGALEEGRR